MDYARMIHIYYSMAVQHKVGEYIYEGVVWRHLVTKKTAERKV